MTSERSHTVTLCPSAPIMEIIRVSPMALYQGLMNAYIEGWSSGGHILFIRTTANDSTDVHIKFISGSL